MVNDSTPENRQKVDHALAELDGLIEAGSPVWWMGEEAAAEANMAVLQELGG